MQSVEEEFERGRLPMVCSKPSDNLLVWVVETLVLYGLTLLVFLQGISGCTGGKLYCGLWCRRRPPCRRHQHCCHGARTALQAQGRLVPPCRGSGLTSRAEWPRATKIPAPTSHPKVRPDMLAPPAGVSYRTPEPTEGRVAGGSLCRVLLCLAVASSCIASFALHAHCASV